MQSIHHNRHRSFLSYPLRQGKYWLESWLFPAHCLLCPTPVQQHGGFCLDCHGKLGWLHAPLCPVCGLPQADDTSSPLTSSLLLSAPCPSCQENPPPFQAARSVVAYDEHSRPLIHRLKFHDQLYLARPLGHWMAHSLQPILPASDAPIPTYILPVPLHRWRLFHRMSNQSLLLARAMGQVMQLPVLPHTLQRIRSTRRQTGLSRSQRLKNLHRAFAISPQTATLLSGAHVILVDDVMTTGATIEACCRALRKAGVARITVATFARTL